ncbi:MAG: hypothetical protein Q7S65_00265 [Nanoarchaeota archaeon]|nr:hypothetical protein [Nanoarchaeota archaeon]
MNLKHLRSKLVHSKVYLQRALGYASLINLALILFLALSNLEKYGVDVPLERWGVPLFILLFFLLIFLGFLEDKLGIFSEEQRVTSGRNPQTQEILKRLERIEQKLK